MPDSQSGTRDKFFAGLSPATRRDFAEEAEELAALVEAAGFLEEAETIWGVASWLEPRRGRRDVVVMTPVGVEDMHGPDLVWHLLRRDERPQSWLARKLDVTPTTVSRWLSGERPITAMTGAKLAELWPEFVAERFVTSAASARRAS